eukprot:gene26405-4417_t
MLLSGQLSRWRRGLRSRRSFYSLLKYPPRARVIDAGRESEEVFSALVGMCASQVTMLREAVGRSAGSVEFAELDGQHADTGASIVVNATQVHDQAHLKVTRVPVVRLDDRLASDRTGTGGSWRTHDIVATPPLTLMVCVCAPCPCDTELPLPPCAAALEAWAQGLHNHRFPAFLDQASAAYLHLHRVFDTSLQVPVVDQRVFDPVPDGKRLCVTSLTLPGIRYVVDTGKAKQRRYDGATGVARFEVDWISVQRAGRAGRVGPGHAYRLFSTAVYANHCADHTTPEILESPLESLVLFVKGFWDRSPLAFPFPTPPPRPGIEASLTHLARIGALTHTQHAGGDGGQYTICPFGRAVGRLPLLPKYGKMLVLAKALWEPPPLPPSSQQAAGRFCDDHFLVFRSMSDAAALRRQLTQLLASEEESADVYGALADEEELCCWNGRYDPHRYDATAVTVAQRKAQRLRSVLGRTGGLQSEDEEVVVRKIIAAGLIDQVARRATPADYVAQCAVMG